MAKQTKRSRKFERKGGVKAHLEKGTITRKGKLKRKQRKKQSTNTNPHDDAAEIQGKTLKRQREQARQEQEFKSEANLGDLDLDSFFEAVVDEKGNDPESRSDDDDGSSDGTSSTEQDKEGSSDESSVQEENGEKKSANSSSSSTSSDESSSEDSNSSSDDDEDDSDDIEAASKQMKLEMTKLQQSDPDFHKFLQENEQSLLEFGNDDEEEDEEDDEEAQGEPVSETEKVSDEKETPSNYTPLTPKLLKSMQEGAFESHGVKSLKKIVAAYKSACHLSDTDEEKVSQKGKHYDIDSSEVFDQLMVSCLENVHKEFQHHLLSAQQDSTKDKDESEDDTDNDANKPIPPKVLMRSPRWDSMKPIMESFFRSTMHVLVQAKEPELVTFVLKALENYVRYLTPSERLASNMLQTLVELWSAPLDESSQEYQVVRLQSFLRIRQLALTQPFPFVELCLKKTYLAYAKRAKFASNLPTLTFMGNCLVELYGLDHHSSYQHAFVYIRQLSLHLRTAMQKKTPESFQAVYCWQYMHCLKLWTAVLVASSIQEHDEHVGSDSKLLQSLVYPLVEVILGVIRLIPTVRYIPLRFQCIRMIQQLAAAFETFVPLPMLLEVLDFKEIYLKPKRIANRSTTRGLNLPLLLKLPKENPLRTTEQLEAVMGELFLLLNRQVDLYRYSAGFAEFSVGICQRLRKFAKETKNGRWRAYAKGCMEQCDRFSDFCVKERSKLQEAPKDVKILEVLKPSGEPNMYSRHEAMIAKEKRLEAAARPVVATTSSGGANKRKVQDEQEEEEKKKAPTKKRRNKKKAQRKVIESDLKNTDALKQDDEVQEGIDWSDDE